MSHLNASYIDALLANAAYAAGLENGMTGSPLSTVLREARIPEVLADFIATSLSHQRSIQVSSPPASTPPFGEAILEHRSRGAFSCQFAGLTVVVISLRILCCS
jgi:hypothetical protein